MNYPLAKYNAGYLDGKNLCGKKRNKKVNRTILDVAINLVITRIIAGNNFGLTLFLL